MATALNFALALPRPSPAQRLQLALDSRSSPSSSIPPDSSSPRRRLLGESPRLCYTRAGITRFGGGHEITSSGGLNAAVECSVLARIHPEVGVSADADSRRRLFTFAIAAGRAGAIPVRHAARNAVGCDLRDRDLGRRKAARYDSRNRFRYTNRRWRESARRSLHRQQ